MPPDPGCRGSSAPSRSRSCWCGSPSSALLNTTVPQLEEVGKLRAVSMSPNDAPALIATKRVGQVFEEYDTSSSVMIVLEGDDPLGAGRARVLRRDGPKAARRHHPRAARPGLLGRHADRGRCPEHRRQGRLRAGVHRRRPGRGHGQRVGGGRPRHRRRHPGTRGREGVRHRVRRRRPPTRTPSATPA